MKDDELTEMEEKWERFARFYGTDGPCKDIAALTAEVRRLKSLLTPKRPVLIDPWAPPGCVYAVDFAALAKQAIPGIRLYVTRSLDVPVPAEDPVCDEMFRDEGGPWFEKPGTPT